MIAQALQLASIAGILIAAGGLAWGVTGQDPHRRQTGLRLLQAGMAGAGLTLMLAALFGGGGDLVPFGFLLLALGTGVTGIGASRRD